MDAIESIKRDGDQLEAEIFQDLFFAGSFHAYAELWHACLKDRRTTGSIYISGHWELFSQHHYAAIVRAWGALSEVLQIEAIASTWTNTASQRLSMHTRILSLYVHCTALIDNLDKCAGQAWKLLDRGGSPPTADWYSEWAAVRDQRNLDAHDGLRPITDLYGQPVIDKSLLAKGMTWAQGQQHPLPVVQWVRDVWHVAHNCATRAWYALLADCLQLASSTPQTLPPRAPGGGANINPASGVF